MITRPYTKEDIWEVQALIRANQDWNIPDINSPLYILKEVAVNHKGAIIGIGLVRLTSEVILVVDAKQNLATKMTTLKTLMNRGIDESRKCGLDEWHAFVMSYKFAKLLEKLKFVKSKSIATLVRRFYE